MSLQFPTEIEAEECICGCCQTQHFLGVGKCVAFVNGAQCPCFRFRLADKSQKAYMEAERRFTQIINERRVRMQQLDSQSPLTYFVQ